MVCPPESRAGEHLGLHAHANPEGLDFTFSGCRSSVFKAGVARVSACRVSVVHPFAGVHETCPRVSVSRPCALQKAARVGQRNTKIMCSRSRCAASPRQAGGVFLVGMACSRANVNALEHRGDALVIHCGVHNHSGSLEARVERGRETEGQRQKQRAGRRSCTECIPAHLLCASFCWGSEPAMWEHVQR